jgi:hypothetical protein
MRIPEKEVDPVRIYVAGYYLAQGEICAQGYIGYIPEEFISAAEGLIGGTDCLFAKGMVDYDIPGELLVPVDFFVGNHRLNLRIAAENAFHSMGKGRVPDIMQKACGPNPSNVQGIQSQPQCYPSSNMHCTNAMLEPGVVGPWVDSID